MVRHLFVVVVFIWLQIIRGMLVACTSTRMCLFEKNGYIHRVDGKNAEKICSDLISYLFN